MRNVNGGFLVLFLIAGIALTAVSGGSALLIIAPLLGVVILAHVLTGAVEKGANSGNTCAAVVIFLLAVAILIAASGGAMLSVLTGALN